MYRDKTVRSKKETNFKIIYSQRISTDFVIRPKARLAAGTPIPIMASPTGPVWALLKQNRSFAAIAIVLKSS